MALGATDRLRVEERGVSETGWCLLHYRVGEKFLLPNMEGVIMFTLFTALSRSNAAQPNHGKGDQNAWGKEGRTEACGWHVRNGDHFRSAMR